MFKRLKHYSVARKQRKQLLKNLEEIKNEDLFSEGVVEIRSEERLEKLDSSTPFLSYTIDRSKKIQVSQAKRYKKKIPVRIGVA